MSATGLAVFDSTLQKTNIWLDDIMDELDSRDRHRAYHALRTVLQALRDRLPINESAQLAAQLPQLIRGVYFEGWNPASKNPKERHWDQFVDHVGEAFANDPDCVPEILTRAVLRVLGKHVSSGEIVDVKRCLPEDIRRHWR